MAERICLIKYVLSSISLFYFSLYKMPYVELKEIVRIHKKIL